VHQRSTERQQLARKLESGRNIHMPAPRRIGKTWTIKRLAIDLRQAGWQAIEADVQAMSSPEQFAAELCARIEAETDTAARIKAHVMQRFTNLLGGGWGDKPLDAVGRVNPLQFAETLIAGLNDSGKNTVVFVDEIAYFFLAFAQKDAKGAYDFAYQLRAWQLRYQNVRWLITGSIGLDTIAHRYNFQGAFVDFDTFVLLPFTKDEARSFLRDPMTQKQFNHPFQASDAELDAMFDDLGWLAPFYLRLVANEVRPLVAAGGKIGHAAKADFDAAFERLLQPDRKGEFAVWHEHISKNLPVADQAVARHVLGVLSQNPAGEIEDTLVAQLSLAQPGVTRRQMRDVLNMLSNDGMLVKSDTRWRFRSGLVRRYWREYEVE
jgi:hypothetical protein